MVISVTAKLALSRGTIPGKAGLTTVKRCDTLFVGVGALEPPLPAELAAVVVVVSSATTGIAPEITDVPTLEKWGKVSQI